MTNIYRLLLTAYCLLSAAAAQSIAPKRPLVFPISAGPNEGNVPSVECVVNFGPPLPISALAFSPDGQTLAVGGYREVLLWDLIDAKLAGRIGRGQLSGLVHAVAFVDGGKALAVGDGVPGQSGAVNIFNLETAEPTATFQEPKKVVYCLAASPDGKYLAAGDGDSSVYVWDLTTGQLAQTIEAHSGWVLGAAFAADAKQLATAGADHTLRIWEVETWQPILQYDLPATVQSVTFNPNGKIVIGAVGGEDEWALRIGRLDGDPTTPRRRLNTRAISTGTGMPLDIVWPAKAACVFVACNDHTVRAYQGAQGRLLMTYRGHTDWVYCVAATPDGSKLASGSADGTVKLWNGAGGKPLATFVQLSPGTDDWLIMTRRGHFATSYPEAIEWRTTDSSTPAEDLTSRYHHPDRVRQTLAADTTPPSAFKRKGKAAKKMKKGT